MLNWGKSHREIKPQPPIVNNWTAPSPPKRLSSKPKKSSKVNFKSNSYRIILRISCKMIRSYNLTTPTFTRIRRSWRCSSILRKTWWKVTNPKKRTVKVYKRFAECEVAFHSHILCLTNQIFLSLETFIMVTKYLVNLTTLILVRSKNN